MRIEGLGGLSSVSRRGGSSPDGTRRGEMRVPEQPKGPMPTELLQQRPMPTELLHAATRVSSAILQPCQVKMSTASRVEIFCGMDASDSFCRTLEYD